MSNHDERAVEIRDDNRDNQENRSSSSFSDFERVLKLISAQVEDSERRQAQLLLQVSERLARLETSGEATGEQSAPDDEQASANVEASLARLAAQIAIPPNAESSNTQIDMGVDAEGSQMEGDAEGSQMEGDAEGSQMEGDAEGSHQQPTSSAAHDNLAAQPDAVAQDATVGEEAYVPAEPDVWVDNAADQANEQANLDRDLEAWSLEADDAPRNAAPAPATTPAPKAAALSQTETSTDPWSDDDAERLMQVCEREMFAAPDQIAPDQITPEQAAPVQTQIAPEQNDVFDHEVEAHSDAGQEAMPTGPETVKSTHVYEDAALAADVEISKDVKSEFEPTQHEAEPVTLMAQPEAKPVTTTEMMGEHSERLAEIAQRVEQTLADMRAHDPVTALRSRFEQFHEDVTSAFSDVATRSDIQSLKEAETQIEDLRRHFERVQDQLTRLDGVEKQLESVMDRLSDDRLVTLLASHGTNQPDQRELAAVIGEYVANRVSTEQTDDTNVDERLGALQNTLTSFIEEQRESKEKQTGVLDTLQDAMLQVLDRVDAIDTPAHPDRFEGESAQYAPESPPQPAPEQATPIQAANAQDEHSVERTEPTTQSAHDNPALAQYAPATPVHEEYVSEISEQATPPDAQPMEAPENLETMSASAISAATAASQRHPDFEPFSTDVATSSLGSDASQYTQYEASPADAVPEGADQALDQVDAPLPPAPNVEPVGNEQVGNHQIASEAQPVSESQPGNSVARLRQEFIVEAHRAKARADELAIAQAEADRLAPKKKGISLFGFTIGGKAAPKAPEANAPQPVVPPAASTTSGGPQVFGFSRSKILIGAFVLMITASGVLLLMPRGTQAPAPIPAPAIERTLPQSLSTGQPAPGALVPAGVDAAGVDVVPDARTTTGNDAGPDAGTLTPPKETKGILRDDTDPGVPGDRSEIIEPWSRTLGAINAPGRHAVATLDGVALQTPTRPTTDGDLARFANNRSMAHWSLRLGEAASRASMASLLPDYNPDAPAAAAAGAPQIEKTAVQVRHTTTAPSRSQATASLDLPPASVGPLSLRLAAAKGDPSAEFEVGTRLAAGTGTKQNLKEAVKWYTRSASRGFAQSQYRLGTFYERGLGVKKDVKRAQIWYRRAAEKGNIKAMHNLAVLSAGSATGSPDYTTAAQWFQKASERGLADSQYNLAVLNENGLGVKQDLVNAYRLYALAARSGDKDAKKRRDALKAKLSQQDLTAAQSQVKNWRRKTTDKLANDVFTAGQAWKSRVSNKYSN